MHQRPVACGTVHSKNSVNITNYGMLEYGQPLHAIDYENISGKKIIVRRAGEGEKFRTLDDVERTLSSETLVITDGKQPVAIAGVMGGAGSEVTDKTTSILLEAASFNQASIHFTVRALGLSSAACMRFERGIRADLDRPALTSATQLTREVAGGEGKRTKEQWATMLELIKGKGLSMAGAGDMCKKETGHSPGDLTVKAANDFIKHMEGLPDGK